jgi:hypothetical protein
VIKVRYGNIRYGFSGRKQCCSPVAVIPKKEALKKFDKHGFILLEPYTTSSKALNVICKKCGKKSKRSMQSLERDGKKLRCVWCANLRKDSKEVIAFMTKNGLKPKTPYKGANEPWKCICLKCKKEVSSSYASVRDGSGCGYCKKNIVDPKDARKNMISWGYKPLEPYKNNHKNCCNSEKQKAHNDKKYQYIRDNGGWDCFNMIEVEKFPCNDGNEARAREEYWRCHFNSQLNSIRAYRTEEQRKEIDKERKREYREHEKYREYQKEYQKKYYYNKKNKTDSSSDDSTECITH